MVLKSGRCKEKTRENNSKTGNLGAILGTKTENNTAKKGINARLIVVAILVVILGVKTENSKKGEHIAKSISLGNKFWAKPQISKSIYKSKSKPQNKVKSPTPRKSCGEESQSLWEGAKNLNKEGYICPGNKNYSTLYNSSQQYPMIYF